MAAARRESPPVRGCALLAEPPDRALRLPLPAAVTLALVAIFLLLGASAAHASSWQLHEAAAPSLGAGDELTALFALDGGTAWAVGLGDAVHYTHDGGRSWEAQQTGAPAGTDWQDVHFVDRRCGVLAGAAGDTGLLYLTGDGGRTWREVLRARGTRLTGLEFNGAELGWATGRGGTVYATADGGATWSEQRAATNAHLNAVAFAGWYKGGVIGDRGLAVGDRGTIMRTVDGGLTWKKVRSHTTRRLRDVAYVTRRIAYAVGERGTVLKTTSWGHRWKPLRVPAHGAACLAVDFASARHGLVALSSGKLLDTRDGGRTWHVVKHGLGDLGELKDVDFALPPEGTAAAAAAAVGRAGASAGGHGDESTDPTRGWIAAGDDVSRYIASGTSTHDNWVYLYPVDSKGHYDPPSGSNDPVCPRTTDFSFDLADYAITYGQPYDGWTTRTGDDDSMTDSGEYFAVDFIAGRHHTETPADLFSTYTGGTALCVGMSDSTPGDLNFAFYGTLTSGATSTDVCFGQGDYDGDNNWWIGSATFSKPSYSQLVTADGMWRIGTAPTGNYDGFMFTWYQ